MQFTPLIDFFKTSLYRKKANLNKIIHLVQIGLFSRGGGGGGNYHVTTRAESGTFWGAFSQAENFTAPRLYFCIHKIINSLKFRGGTVEE